MWARGRPKLCVSRRFWRSYSARSIDERWPDWQPVIGIEVHSQIRASKKLFSPTTVDVDAQPNSHVSLFDAAFPGTLPVLNPNCVNLATRTALALGSQVHTHSSFDRKHYFYADLPAGYQITQHYSPFATDGSLHVDYVYKKQHASRVVRIKQIQLEQDTAKSTSSINGRETLIDLNRAGAALMEIVSEPDLRSPEEAGAYIRALQAILRAVGASSGNMEEGSLRCDVNVSVGKPGEEFGTRCEIKNLNTIRGVMIAITSEIYRQISLLSSGQSIPQETRGFDEDKAETFKLRSKEDAPDYRYMPDPNLPPLILTEEYVESVRASMPDLPPVIREQLASQYNLPERDIEVLMSMQAIADVPFDGAPKKEDALSYFKELADGRSPRVAANWMTHELLGDLAYRGESFSPVLLPAKRLGELIDLVESGELTATSGKALLRHLLEFPSNESITGLVDKLSLRAAGAEDLQKLCEAAIAALPREAESARAGNERVVMRFVGEVMKISKGRADAKAAGGMLRKLLGVDAQSKRE